MNKTRRTNTRNMVTRTIKTIDINMLCLDISTTESKYIIVTLTGNIKENEYFILASNIIETETLKPVHIHEVKETEQLYGMLESDFIKQAEILPPR